MRRARLAHVLNERGWTTGSGQHFDGEIIRWVRRIARYARLKERLQTTQASSSSGASWQERLRGIQEEQGRLVERWRTGLRSRVDSAQEQLQIALLERELQRAG